MHAMSVGANQILVAPPIFLQDPLLFFEKMAEHSVTMSFAPNFLIAAVCKAYEAQKYKRELDLSKVRHVVSGGEANVVSTGTRFGEIMASMGASRGVLKTAFGMTEVISLYISQVTRTFLLI